MSFVRGRFPMFPFGDLSGGNSEEFCELYLREFHLFTQGGDVFGSNGLFRLTDGLFRWFRESAPGRAFARGEPFTSIAATSRIAAICRG